MEMVVRAKREVKPLAVKLGIALALSFAGFLFSHLRSWPRILPPRLPRSSGGDSEASSKSQTPKCSGLKEELRLLKTDESLAKIINDTTTTTTTTTKITTTLVGLSPTSRSSGDEEGFLLPEFNDIVLKELEAVGKDPESTSNNTMFKKAEGKDESAMEQEIIHLQNLVLSLRERERSLELELLEYYGMQEREAAVRELENQLKLNSVEAQLYTLKIESLQADKQRLQAQVSEYSKVIADLEAAKYKIKFLKKKMRTDGEQAKQKFISLQKKISMLQEICQRDGRDNAEVELELKKFKELEDEAARLRKVNSELALENSELLLKLESTKALASTLVKLPEARALEEASELRQQSDKLREEIDQLKTDRCADVEELVYLRWVNACLRYELRNYQAPPGKTVAKDLSKNMSPKSEAKAKQLILEYAKSGVDVKSFDPSDFESEYSSSPRTSSGEYDDSSFDIPTTSKISRTGKPKFFAKLKKLVLGKHSHSNEISSLERVTVSFRNSEGAISFSSSTEDAIGRNSYESLSSCMTEDRALGIQLIGMDGRANEYNQKRPSSPRNFTNHYFDVQRQPRLNIEDDKNEGLKSEPQSPYTYNRMVAGEESLNGGSSKSLDGQEDETPEKVELKKFANALKRTHRVPAFKRSSSSFSG